MRAWRALISGRVQQVGFRQAVKRKALELGLHGTVRNLVDGSVELITPNSREELDLLLEALKKRPPPIRIDEIHIEVCDVSNLPSIFEIV